MGTRENIVLPNDRVSPLYALISIFVSPLLVAGQTTVRISRPVRQVTSPAVLGVEKKRDN